MTDQNSPPPTPAPVSLLLQLTERYPDCFNWQKPKPLKIGIHKDIMASRSDENPINPAELRRTMWRYCNRPLYRKAMRAGVSRIDLQGQPVGQVTEEEAARVKADLAARRAEKSGKPVPLPANGTAVSPSKLLPPNDTPLPKEHLVPGRLELTVKFSELPRSLPVQGGIKIGIQTGEGIVTTILSPKAWRKLEQAAATYPQWVAAMSGALGRVNGDTLELKQPALQVFEKKPKPQENPQEKPLTETTSAPTGVSEVPAVKAPAPQESAAPALSSPFPKLSLKDRAKPKGD